MTDRRLKRFMVPVEDVATLLKGGAVSGNRLPADAKIPHLKFHPEFGELEIIVRSAEFDQVPLNWREAPMSENVPIIGAKP